MRASQRGASECVFEQGKARQGRPGDDEMEAGMETGMEAEMVFGEG